MLAFAKEVGHGIPIRLYSSRDPDESTNRLAFVTRLQSWGAPVEITDPRLMENGQAFLRDMVESLVAKKVARIMEGVGGVWGKSTLEKIQETLPKDFMDAEQRDSMMLWTPMRIT